MMWKRPVRRLVRAGLRQPRLKALIQSELKPRPTTVLADPSVVGATFTDRHGTEHPLDAEIRTRLKPGWRIMVDPVTAAQPPTDDALQTRSKKAGRIVVEASAVLATLGQGALTGRILEVGCYDGAVAYRLAGRPGASVVASDMARYYVIQRPGIPIEAAIDEERGHLATLRARARAAAGASGGAVEFVEDDITTSVLEPGSFDAVVSFEVLEHVRDPGDAFAAMARVLRPGGIMYHDYNPFFSANGGHSLCTLDFPWGHARLDAGDFERYLRERRPAVVDQTLRFYRESLNRMTLAALRTSLVAAGLEPVAVIPWVDRRLAPTLDPDVLREVRRIYPDATIDDLLATFVTVVARKP